VIGRVIGRDTWRHATAAADALDLPEVQQIVPCVQPAQVLQALFPAFSVNPCPLQVRGDAPSTSRRFARRSSANSASASDGSAWS